jgi:hypothetical protein
MNAYNMIENRQAFDLLQDHCLYVYFRFDI